MKYKAYRIGKFKIFQLFALAISFFLMACNDEGEQDYPDPFIQFVKGTGYVSVDTTFAVGQIFKIGIHAESNGQHKLTNFIAKLNGERYLDLGIYKDVFDKDIEISRGLEEFEDWEFIIRDINGNSNSVYVTIFKDPDISYGEIDAFLNVELGAQFNTTIGSFFSLTNGQVYNLENAYNNSELIDIAYYYDNFDKLEENIITSPGANIGETAFPGEFAISNWATVNTTRYSREKLDVSSEAFDNATNDSILIANTFAFESGGRKTKYLKAGDIYPFVRGDRTGMFKVVSTSGTTEGKIIVDIKIQK